ncbi:MAG: rRNA maturation RNase YbeY [Bradymonadaceae bacterium]
MSVEITRQGKARKHPRLKELQTAIRQSLETLYHALDLLDPELSLVLTDDAHMSELNATWMGEEGPTDVLSFPLYDGEDFIEDMPALGDIVINVEYADRLVQTQDHRHRVAEELGVDVAELRWSVVEEVVFLFIHGLLHLIGHDHGDPLQETEMKSEERRLWESVAPLPHP